MRFTGTRTKSTRSLGMTIVPYAVTSGIDCTNWSAFCEISSNLSVRQSILPLLASTAKQAPSQLQYTRLPSVSAEGTKDATGPRKAAPPHQLFMRSVILSVTSLSMNWHCQTGVSLEGSVIGPSASAFAIAVDWDGRVVGSIRVERYSAATTSLPAMVTAWPADFSF